MAKIGLVLGAGGMAGHAYHVGVLTAVQEALDWDPREAEVIVGTSAGSGVGSLLRAGLSVADLRARVERRPLSAPGQAITAGLGPRDPFPPFRLPSGRPQPAAPSLLLADLARPWRFRLGHMAAALPVGKRPTTAIQELHDHLHREHRWPDRALWITTVRLRDGGFVVLGRDRQPETTVGKAVAASSAIPGYFAPVVIDGERYVDGGVHSPTNADLLTGLGLDTVIVSSPMSAPPRATRAATGVTARLLGRPLHHLRLVQELARYRRSGDRARLVVFEPTVADQRAMGTSAMEPTTMPAIAIAAESSARAQLAAGDGRSPGRGPRAGGR